MSERASGLLSSLFGLGITLALLGVAAQIALGLMARTTAEAVAYDTARRAATAPVDVPAQVARARALAHGRHELGDRADEVDLEFLDAPEDRVVLRVRAEGVHLLPRMFGGGATVGDLDRRIVLVRERP